MFARLILLLLVSAPLLYGQSPDKVLTSYSSSRRVLMKNIASPDAHRLGLILEDLIQRVEQQIGWQMQVDSFYPIVISAKLQDGNVGGLVIRQQSGTPDLPRQRIVLVNPLDVDQEEFRSSFIWLLLNRYLSAQWPERETVPRIEDWFSTGMSQWLHPALRRRNLDVISRAWSEGATPDAAGLLLYSNDDGWTKAWLSIAYAWLVGKVDDPGDWSLLMTGLETMANRDASWISQIDSSLISEEQIQKDWFLFVADVIRDSAGIAAADDLEQRIQDAIALAPEQFRHLMEEGEEPPAMLEDMIRYRGRDWVHQTANAIHIQLRSIAVQADKEAAGVINKYLRFLEVLSGNIEDYSGGLLGSKGSARKVKSLLRDARENHRDWLEERVARTAWMNQIEQQAQRRAAYEKEGIHPDEALKFMDEVTRDLQHR